MALRRCAAWSPANRTRPHGAFVDRTLIEMAELRPTTRSEMATLHEAGAAKPTRFGDVFPRAVKAFGRSG
ncbi:HRDC domain-containing protein [Pinisolibacter aquiterrae]|uniref:HRDC domain-containing protein n=1 Tax=Pinisolibacter aquiterrae TaxID=2815579 RepID=UPI003B75BEBD